MLISEVFGYGVDNHSEEAWSVRRMKLCPFRSTPCTKSSKDDPIGICSISDGHEAVALCPVRLIERDVIFKDAARLAFGANISFAIFPEIRILNIRNRQPQGRGSKIGKVDYLLGKIVGGDVIDFAALEVQTSYFSGNEIRTPLRHYIENKSLDLPNSDRRPDFRSSAQKRLVPQLQLKVPVFRRWGRSFFVVVDTHFFRALPEFSSTSHANSEVTWLSYPIERSGTNYTMSNPTIVYSEWDEVRNSLREGTPPDPDEILAELRENLQRRRNAIRVLGT